MSKYEEMKKWILKGASTHNPTVDDTRLYYGIMFDFSNMTEQLFVSDFSPDARNYANGDNYGWYEQPLFISPKFRILTILNIILKEIESIDYDTAIKTNFSCGISPSILSQFIFERASAKIKEIWLRESVWQLVIIREALYDIAKSNHGLDLFLLDKYSPWIGDYHLDIGSLTAAIVRDYEKPLSEWVEDMHKSIQDDRKIMRFACDSWHQLLWVTLKALATNNITIHRCKLCGKLFIPENRTDELYCQFPNEDYKSRPCREVYKQLAKDKYNKNSEVIQLNKRIYNRLIKRSPGEARDYREARDKIREKQTRGELTKEDYLEWLRKMDIETRVYRREEKE